MTRKLFAAYGIDLEENVLIQGNGYAFEADGYNRSLNVGFEIRGLGEEATLNRVPSGDNGATGQRILDSNEILALEKDVNRDKVDILFIAPSSRLNASTDYYLLSVVDYLNWIHGDREMEYQPSVPVDPEYRATGPIRVLWDVNQDDMDARWVIGEEDGSADLEENSSAMLVKLKPGGKLTYHSPEPIPYQYGSLTIFKLAVSHVTPDDIPVDIDLYVNSAPGTRMRHSFVPQRDRELGYWPYRSAKQEVRPVETLSIVNVNRFSIVLRIAGLVEEELG